MELAEFLVGSLDDRAGSPRRSRRWRRPPARARGVRARAQGDPGARAVGVGARDLRECLLIQLEARGERDTLPWRIIADRFDHLVNRRFPEIARQLRCSVEEVQAAADVIATLNPRPGLQVSADDPRYVVPDLLVERVSEEYVVLLNDRHLPRLRIASAYEACCARRKIGVHRRRGEDPRVHPEQAELGALADPDDRAAPPARWIKVMNCIIASNAISSTRHRVPPAAHPPAGGAPDRHARVDREPGVQRQVRAVPARRVRAQVLLLEAGSRPEDGEDVSARTAKDIIKTLIDEEDKRLVFFFLSRSRTSGSRNLLHQKGLRNRAPHRGEVS